MKRAFLFPGQGSQKVGMGRGLAQEFACARDVFAEVDEALSLPLSRIMWEGTEEELTLTHNAQPALMAVSMAVLRVLESESGLDVAEQAALLAGHSLGEYSALAAAGVFSLADTARLLRRRGEAMQCAVPPGEGAMAAVLGLTVRAVESLAEHCGRDGVCSVANDNAPKQCVISGHKEAVERAGEMCRQHGARRVIPLAVSAPFHCALMRPAANEMRAALQEVEMRTPLVPVVGNVLAQPMRDTKEIAGMLVRQITDRVRWRDSMGHMQRQGVEEVVELGAGSVLTGLARRCSERLQGTSLGTAEEIRGYVQQMQSAQSQTQSEESKES